MALAEETTSEINVGKGGWDFVEKLMNQVKIRDVVPAHKNTTVRWYQKIWRKKSRRGEKLNGYSSLQSQTCKEMYF